MANRVGSAENGPVLPREQDAAETTSLRERAVVDIQVELPGKGLRTYRAGSMPARFPATGGAPEKENSLLRGFWRFSLAMLFGGQENPPEIFRLGIGFEGFLRVSTFTAENI